MVDTSSAGNSTATKDRYHVYVIELSDTAAKRINPEKPIVYVGQSLYAPDVRFKQHLEGIRASRWVRRFGVRLRPRLYSKLNPLSSQEEALQTESLLAERLRRRGYTVFGGH